jgi:hypothetical protein
MFMFGFDAPGVVLNANDRMGWRQRAELVSMWRLRSMLAAREAINSKQAPRISSGRWEVGVSFAVVGRRRRDPSNWMPTVKAIVDGLVDAGLFDDDHGGRVLVGEPVLVVVGGGDRSPGVVVRVVPVDGTARGVAESWLSTGEVRAAPVEGMSLGGESTTQALGERVGSAGDVPSGGAPVEGLSARALVEQRLAAELMLLGAPEPWVWAGTLVDEVLCRADVAGAVMRLASGQQT